jgi:NitT/TauT family transport system substrate-binding protein
MAAGFALGRGEAASMQRRTFLATGAAIALSTPQPARAQTRAKLRLALIPSDFAAQAWYAKDLGMFERAGLDVELSTISNGAAILAALTAGALDVGFSNIVAVAVAHEKGLPFAFIAAAVVHNSDDDVSGLLAVASNSPIRTAKDLEGKTIAVSGINELAAMTIKHYMEINAADPSKARFIELPFGAMPEAVRSGRVDAASLNRTTAPTIGKTGDPLRVLANTYNAVAPRWSTSAWVATKDWIAKHPTEAQAFTGVMRQAAIWGNAHHRESAAILARAVNEPVEQVEAVQRVPYITSLTPALIQPPIDLAVKYGLLHAPLAAAEILDPLARA